MPPSRRTASKAAAAAAAKHAKDIKAFDAQQAAADRQKQQEIEFLSQQTKLHEDHAKQRASQKMRLERELRENMGISPEQIEKIVAQVLANRIATHLYQPLAPQASNIQPTTPSQTPAAPVPIMPATALLQASGAKIQNLFSLAPSQVLTSQPKDFVHWSNEKQEKAARENRAQHPEAFASGPTFHNVYRSCAGQESVMRKRPEFLKALFEHKNAELYHWNPKCYSQYVAKNQNSLYQTNSSSAIASSSPPAASSSSPPAALSSSPLRQFGSASSPPSSPRESPVSEFMQYYNDRCKKMRRPLTAPPRPVVTEAGPSTPTTNTKAQGKGKVATTYIKQEPVTPSGGVVKRGRGRPRKTDKKQLTMDDYKFIGSSSALTRTAQATRAGRIARKAILAARAACKAAQAAHAAAGLAEWGNVGDVFGNSNLDDDMNDHDSEPYNYEEDRLEIIEAEVEEMDLTV
ncbi:hypothetical protein PtrSN001A_011255 [Pyrenophora tritici-repentis]|nr:hypothetical protein PtrSN001A_011255 [Pyrenophora tritici-repentis]